MKKTNPLKKYATLLLLFCMISMSSYYSMPAVTVSASIVQPLQDNIYWRYKKVGNTWYKRLYNYSSRSWIGDWIPVNNENG